MFHEDGNLWAWVISTQLEGHSLLEIGVDYRQAGDTKLFFEIFPDSKR